MYEIPCKDLTDAQKERLYLLIEECSEVQKQACKILRFGYFDLHPITNIDNTQIFEEEIGDLSACITLMINAGDVSRKMIDSQIPKKFKKFESFTRFQGL